MSDGTEPRGNFKRDLKQWALDNVGKYFPVEESDVPRLLAEIIDEWE